MRIDKTTNNSKIPLTTAEFLNYPQAPLDKNFKICYNVLLRKN